MIEHCIFWSLLYARCCCCRCCYCWCSSSSQQSEVAYSGYYYSNCINLYGHTIGRNPKRLGMNFLIPLRRLWCDVCVCAYVCTMPLHMHKCPDDAYIWCTRFYYTSVYLRCGRETLVARWFWCFVDMVLIVVVVVVVVVVLDRRRQFGSGWVCEAAFGFGMWVNKCG